MSSTNPTRLDETMGPNEASCPETILKLLTPTQNEHALDWRKRCLANLVSNAARYASQIEIAAVHDARMLTVTIDDDGPGIPQERREEVFKPFMRLDESRNLDTSGTGLGLTIARDVARAHGGDITLTDSPLGGLRATVRVPG